MPDRDDANLFEILVGQVTQNFEINIILGKALSVLPETEPFEPVRNLLHRRPSTDLTLSVLDRHVAEFTNLAKIEYLGRPPFFQSLADGRSKGYACPLPL